MSVSLKFGVAVTALACLMAGVVEAQQRQRFRDRIRPAQNQPQNYEVQQAGNQSEPTVADNQGQRFATGQSNEVDNYLANCLATKNQGEIAANQWAQSRTRNPEVKQFAEQMVEDHQKLAQQLQQLAGQQSGSNAALNRLAQIERSIGERCSQMTQAALEEKSGAEFDQCYIGSQIGAHMHMLAALEVIQQQAGGQLRQVAGEAHSIVESHLQHAEQLAETLKNETNQASRQTQNRQ